MNGKGVVFAVVAFLTFPVLGWSQTSDTENPERFKVVLDAGHGGHDPGNIKNGYREKDIALAIVLEVGRQLAQVPGIDVVYTRDKDVFVDLYVRGKIANEAKANLFVSVHCNAHHSQAHGTETFVLGLHANQQNFEVAKKENSVIYLEEDFEVNYAGYDINSPESVIGLTVLQEEFLDQSITIAKSIQDAFTLDLKRKNRGVKQAGFIVLHQTFMPSVLVETGFLSYRPEGEYLNSSKGKKDMANAITRAILTYRNQVMQNVGDDFTFERTSDIPETAENTTVSAAANTEPGDVVFRVQIAAGKSVLEPVPSNFSGLTPVSRLQDGGLYKYFYGEASNLEAARTLQQDATKKGYGESFIVAFRNGRKIPLEQAINSQVN